VHGTCVALGGVCALLSGKPGAGKSDLALRFLFLPAEALGCRPALIADDQVLLRRAGEGITASCPPALEGRIEVRGGGIARIAALAKEARLTLAAELDASAAIARFPERNQWKSILGLPVRRIVINPFEPSAPIKLALALKNVFEDMED
jgi:HPr kinase/phosphorylase